MAGLNDLPNEILLGIIENISPNDIERFCLANQNIYELSAAVRKAHSDLKRKYPAIGHRGFVETDVLPRFLGDVLQNPVLAPYVKEISIGPLSERWEDSTSKRPNGPYGHSLISRLKDAAFQYLPVQIAHDAVSKLIKGSEDPIVAMLMLLLPNLRKITWLDTIPETSSSCVLSQCVNSRGSEAPLSKLEQVILETDSSTLAYDLNMVARFAFIPSVQKLSTRGIASRATDETFLNWPDLNYPESLAFNVTDMTFSETSIDSKTVHEFLGCFRALQKFAWIGQWFSSTDDPQYRDQLFDPFWIRAALLAHARSSLQSLKVLSYETRWRWLGSLLDFQNLQDITTELELLLREKDAKKQKISISEVLPASIRTLCIHSLRGSEGEQLTPGLIAYWASCKEHMSGLHEIEVITDRLLGDLSAWLAIIPSEKLVRECEDVGVRLLLK